MNNKLVKRFVTIVAFMALLVLSVGNVFAITNNQSVVSPYWQADSDSYTFVALTHGSLDGMNSEIGVVISALNRGGSTTFGTSEFTVSQNNTTRMFIVSTNHSSINSASITGSDAVFITGTTTASSGSLLFTPRAASPLADRETGNTFGAQAVDVTMLNYWGAIVISSANSGFAMEFIGDTHDSAFALVTNSAGFSSPPFGLN